LREFHWELEFPDVFFPAHAVDAEATRRPSSRRGARGFDAVIGNPPFLDKKRLVNQHPELDAYWRTCGSFRTARGTYDAYMLFVERGIGLCKPGGRVGLVTPIPWLTQPGGAPLRRL